MTKWLDEADPEDTQEMLDGLVHDCKSSEAADINNAGQEGQLAYLYEQFGGPAKLWNVVGGQLFVSEQFKGKGEHGDATEER